MIAVGTSASIEHAPATSYACEAAVGGESARVGLVRVPVVAGQHGLRHPSRAAVPQATSSVTLELLPLPVPPPPPPPPPPLPLPSPPPPPPHPPTWVKEYRIAIRRKAIPRAAFLIKLSEKFQGLYSVFDGISSCLSVTPTREKLVRSA